MKHTLWKGFAVAVILTAGLLIFTGCTTTSTPTTEVTPVVTAEAASTEAAAADTQSAAAPTATPQQVELPTFNAEELAKYDGKNGNPAYVAVDGKVYDVSSIPQWNGGSHAGGSLSAGQDQSEAIMRSPHGKDVLSKLPIVGLYE